VGLYRLADEISWVSVFALVSPLESGTTRDTIFERTGLVVVVVVVVVV
jgi:hypothetical protein